MTIKKKEETTTSPTHDARLEYYDTLKYIMLSTARAVFRREAQDAISGLTLQYNMVNPYVKQTSEFTSIPNEIKKAQNKLTQGGGSNVRSVAHHNAAASRSNEVWTILLDVDQRIRVAAKNMQLPTMVDGSDDWDEEAFLRGSGL